MLESIIMTDFVSQDVALLPKSPFEVISGEKLVVNDGSKSIVRLVRVLAVPRVVWQP
jgi:hypothetical protein